MLFRSTSSSSFRNTLIIMTSNLGSEYLVALNEDEDVDTVRDEVMGVVRASFRPEFLNRVDEIILFHRLRRSEMGAIVDIQLGRLQELLTDRKITLEIENDARSGLRPSLWRTSTQTCDSARSEEHTSELQSRTQISYAVFCLKKKFF